MPNQMPLLCVWKSGLCCFGLVKLLSLWHLRSAGRSGVVQMRERKEEVSFLPRFPRIAAVTRDVLHVYAFKLSTESQGQIQLTL